MDVDFSDYAPSEPMEACARVAEVEVGSPAEAAGIKPGDVIVEVNGVILDDLITWRWEADGFSCELLLSDGRELELSREPGQDWGVVFEQAVFDGVRTCVNACSFCFLRMLAPDERPSLYVRDDDYRLSFLQGNFVTLTNLSDEELERIVELRLEPMNVSLHAVSPEVRAALIGRNAPRGIECLERLCEEGIEVHAQIVLCPGENDGPELVKTLEWVEERPNISSLAIVPMGYTRHSSNHSRSYSDDPASALAVIESVKPFQERSRAEFGITRFQLSDEFYLAADAELPPAEYYDGYPQFYDGIGMLRAFIDETDAAKEEMGEETLSRLLAADREALIVCGEAALGVMERFVKRLGLEGRARAFSIRNDYYGGNVNVTGLIVACDLLAQLPADLSGYSVVLPETMFNSDWLTLDGSDLAAIQAEIERRGGVSRVSRTSPSALLETLAALVV